MIYPDGSVPSQSSAFSIFNPVIKPMLCAVLKVCLSTVLGSLTDVQSGNRASVRKKLITLWEQCRKSSVVWPRMLQERSRKRAVCYQGSGSCADGTLWIRPRGDARWSVVQAILSLGEMTTNKSFAWECPSFLSFDQSLVKYNWPPARDELSINVDYLALMVWMVSPTSSTVNN